MLPVPYTATATANAGSGRGVVTGTGRARSASKLPSRLSAGQHGPVRGELCAECQSRLQRGDRRAARKFAAKDGSRLAWTRSLSDGTNPTARRLRNVGLGTKRQRISWSTRNYWKVSASQSFPLPYKVMSYGRSATRTTRPGRRYCQPSAELRARHPSKDAASPGPTSHLVSDACGAGKNFCQRGVISTDKA